MARIRQSPKGTPPQLDLSGIYRTIGVGDVLAKNASTDTPAQPDSTSFSSADQAKVALSRAKLDQQKKEVDAVKAELDQKTYEWEQAKNLFSKGLVSEQEYQRNAVAGKQRRPDWKKLKLDSTNTQSC